MNRRTQIFILLSTLAFAPACLPLAWINPPLSVSAAVAPGASREQADADAQATLHFPMRASIHPLQSVPSWTERRVDAGVGWQMMPSTLRSGGFLHGPHLELAYLHPASLPTLFPDPDEPPSASRLALRGQAYPVFSTRDDTPTGLGGTVQFGLDWYSFMSDTFDGCQQPSDDDFADPYEDDEDEDDTLACFAGYGYGERGGGIFVEASYVDIGQERHYWGGVGLRVYVPASLGAGLVVGDIW